jgi:nucleolar protein 15
LEASIAKLTEDLKGAQLMADQEKKAKEKAEPVVTNPRSKLLIKNRIQTGVPKAERGVVYIGRLPKDFFEPDLHKFFSQFGDITRLRLSRSKKNAHSKGYAYIEFELREVAEIVAKEMNNYFIQSQQIKVDFMPNEKVPEGLFKFCQTHMKDTSNVRREKKIAAHNKAAGEEATGRQKRREDETLKRTKSRIQALGIDYSFGDLSSPVKSPAAAPKAAKATKKAKADGAKSPKKAPADGTGVKKTIKKATGSPAEKSPKPSAGKAGNDTTKKKTTKKAKKDGAK